MDLSTLPLFISGIVLLVVGAELLVRGASRLAGIVGISPLVIGLTVVSLGTSSPEIAVSVGAAYNGVPEVALGNVIGSNICNVLLILGLAATVAPLVVHLQLLRWDLPLMVGVSVLVLLLALGGSFGPLHGALLLAILVAYLILLVRLSRREGSLVQAEYAKEFAPPKRIQAGTVALQFLWIILGLGALVLGADWLVEAAVAFAHTLGVSELVISLTIVALGTSLPEVAASLVAVLRGQRDIAVGNVVGSNLWNLLAVLGIGALVAPEGIPIPVQALYFDLPVMVAVALVCLPVFYTGQRVTRWEGLLLLGYYAAYITLQVLQATGNAALAAFQTALLIVLPLTAVVLGVAFLRYRKTLTQSRSAPK